MDRTLTALSQTHCRRLRPSTPTARAKRSMLRVISRWRRIAAPSASVMGEKSHSTLPPEKPTAAQCRSQENRRSSATASRRKERPSAIGAIGAPLRRAAALHTYFLCVPSCPLWFKTFGLVYRFSNHQSPITNHQSQIFPVPSLLRVSAVQRVLGPCGCDL